MSSKAWGVVYAVVMIVTIIAVDFAFLRDETTLRLIVNIAMVLAFGLGYLVLRRRV